MRRGDDLKRSGQTKLLQNRHSKYTVFAPTDDAFKALPEGTIDSLLEPQNLHPRPLLDQEEAQPSTARLVGLAARQHEQDLPAAIAGPPSFI